MIDTFQVQVMSLAEGDTFPLCVLENELNVEHVALENVQRGLDAELEQFGMRNLWHGFGPMHLSE